MVMLSMIKLYIGSCVIAMNNNFIENNIKKFHQSTILYLEQDDQKITVCDNYPEFFDLEFDIEKITKELKELIFLIKNFKQDEKLYFVCISVLGEHILPRGVYVLNAECNRIIRYKRINKELERIFLNKNKDIDLCISYFVNLESAVISYKERGFVEAILQIGALKENIRNKYKGSHIEIEEGYINANVISHELGINVNKQLFISNDYIKKIIIN